MIFLNMNRNYESRVEALIVRFQVFDFQMQSFVPLFGVAIIFPQQFQGRNLGPSINDVGHCIGRRGGVKNWSKLPKDSTKKLPILGRRCQ